MERGEIGKGKVFLIANKKVGEIENWKWGGWGGDGKRRAFFYENWNFMLGFFWKEKERVNLFKFKGFYLHLRDALWDLMWKDGWLKLCNKLREI